MYFATAFSILNRGLDTPIPELAGKMFYCCAPYVPVGPLEHFSSGCSAVRSKPLADGRLSDYNAMRG
jgi:hypothetical protein